MGRTRFTRAVCLALKQASKQAGELGSHVSMGNGVGAPQCILDIASICNYGWVGTYIRDWDMSWPIYLPADIRVRPAALVNVLIPLGA